MRYYLDTNILIFTLFSEDKTENLSRDVMDILSDYENLFYTNTVCIRELLHLYKSDHVDIKKSKVKNALKIIEAVLDANIKIIPVTEAHLNTYAVMEIPYGNHNDPNDHIIIAQSICDRIPVITSDSKFKLYENQGLKMVLNKR